MQVTPKDKHSRLSNCISLTISFLRWHTIDDYMHSFFYLMCKCFDVSCVGSCISYVICFPNMLAALRNLDFVALRVYNANSNAKCIHRCVNSRYPERGIMHAYVYIYIYIYIYIYAYICNNIYLYIYIYIYIYIFLWVIDVYITFIYVLHVFTCLLVYLCLLYFHMFVYCKTFTLIPVRWVLWYY